VFRPALFLLARFGLPAFFDVPPREMNGVPRFWLQNPFFCVILQCFFLAEGRSALFWTSSDESPTGLNLVFGRPHPPQIVCRQSFFVFPPFRRCTWGDFICECCSSHTASSASAPPSFISAFEGVMPLFPVVVLRAGHTPPSPPAFWRGREVLVSSHLPTVGLAPLGCLPHDLLGGSGFLIRVSSSLAMRWC